MATRNDITEDHDRTTDCCSVMLKIRGAKSYVTPPSNCDARNSNSPSVLLWQIPEAYIKYVTKIHSGCCSICIKYLVDSSAPYYMASNVITELKPRKRASTKCIYAFCLLLLSVKVFNL
jgi:hypothetical protein